MMRKIILPLIVLAASVLGAVTLLATSPKLTPSIPTPVPTTVRTIEVQPQEVSLTVHSQGTVQPTVQSDLIPEISGQVVWMSPNLVAGGYFKKGDPLLRLDRADYQDAATRARASLTRAQAELENTQFEYERLKSLVAKKLVSQSQLENALRAYRVAEASLQDTRAAYQKALRDLKRTEMQAPFTGLVRSKQVDLGQFVSRGAPIAKIYASDNVEVRLPLANKQLAYLNLPLGSRGQLPLEQSPLVKLVAEFAGETLTWQGRIVRTEAEIDPKSRMVHVVARVDNNTQEKPLSVGLFVEAEIEGKLAKKVYVLPRQALRNDNEVLVVAPDNTLHYRSIDTLRLYQDKVLIKGGLEAGEKVCISPLQTVIEGMSVNPVPDQV